jgi:hypothetical protein
MPVAPLLGPNDKLGQIRNVADPPMEAKNEFTVNNQYSASNPAALSKKGKGEYNGTIGSTDDINQRSYDISKNKFNQNKVYNGPY